MVKDFTANELALLDTKPSQLDPIQKKERERLKAREYMSRHRTKLRDSLGTEEYKKTVNKKMFDYRNQKDIEYLDFKEKNTTDVKEIQTIKKTKAKIKSTIEPRELSIRTKIPVDKRIASDTIVFDKQGLNKMKDKVPAWKSAMIKEVPNVKVNDEDFIRLSGYFPEPLKKILTLIINVMRDVYKVKLPENLKAVLIYILRGHNIEKPFPNGKFDSNNIGIFKQHLDKYLGKNKIHVFLNDLTTYYYENERREGSGKETLKAKLGGFVNILSRVDSYYESYQVLTKVASQIYLEYEDKNLDNKVSSRDKSKLILMRDNYDINDVEHNKKLLEENDLKTEEKALAAMYLLQPPRRLDIDRLRFTQMGHNPLEQASLDKNSNWLVCTGKTPVLQIYNTYKTATKNVGKTVKRVLGSQILPVFPAVAEYLEKHLKENNLKLGDYIFGVNTYSQQQSNMSKKVSKVMFKIFNEKGMGARILRQGAAMWNQNDTSRTDREVNMVALAMGHSADIQRKVYNKKNLDDVEDEVVEIKKPRDTQVAKGNKIPIEVKQEVPGVKTRSKVVLKPVVKIGNVRRNPPKKRK